MHRVALSTWCPRLIAELRPREAAAAGGFLGKWFLSNGLRLDETDTRSTSAYTAPSTDSASSCDQETGFFRSWGGSWDTDYGRFFLGWYSSALERHGDRVLAAAARVFRSSQPPGPTR